MISNQSQDAFFLGVYGFQHDSLEQLLESTLAKDQADDLSMKNFPGDMPKVLAKELENQMSYVKESKWQSTVQRLSLCI